VAVCDDPALADCDAIDPHDMWRDGCQVSELGLRCGSSIKRFLERSISDIRPDHEVDNLAMECICIADARIATPAMHTPPELHAWSVISRR